MEDYIKIIGCVLLILVCAWSFKMCYVGSTQSNRSQTPYILPMGSSFVMFFSVSEWISSGRFRIPADPIFWFYIVMMCMIFCALGIFAKTLHLERQMSEAGQTETVAETTQVSAE